MVDMLWLRPNYIPSQELHKMMNEWGARFVTRERGLIILFRVYSYYVFTINFIIPFLSEFND
jgi:hypothetical protein